MHILVSKGEMVPVCHAHFVSKGGGVVHVRDCVIKSCSFLSVSKEWCLSCLFFQQGSVREVMMLFSACPCLQGWRLRHRCNDACTWLHLLFARGEDSNVNDDTCDSGFVVTGIRCTAWMYLVQGGPYHWQCRNVNEYDLRVMDEWKHEWILFPVTYILPVVLNRCHAFHYKQALIRHFNSVDAIRLLPASALLAMVPLTRFDASCWAHGKLSHNLFLLCVCAVIWATTSLGGLCQQTCRTFSPTCNTSGGFLDLQYVCVWAECVHMCVIVMWSTSE
jgi:hypothetical protein